MLPNARAPQTSTSRTPTRLFSATLSAAALATAAVTAAGLAAVVAAPAAHAAPAPHVTSITELAPQVLQVDVYSPAMDRVIPNHVLRPRGGGPAPTLYLLGGVKGGTDGVGWLRNSDYEGFFADKHVNVVTPIGGPSSNYTDWRFDDPILGPAQANQWQTYLTQELPGVIAAQFGATGRNAVAGLSMSAGPAVDLAIQAPWLYDAVAALSGCPMNSGLIGTAQVAAVVAASGGNAFNMWGPPGDPHWTAHDPYLRAGDLHGTAVYLAAASGIPGPVDNLAPHQVPGAATGGGSVEAFSNACTAALSQRLNAEGVPHTYRYSGLGAHTWGLFESELRDAWHTTLGPALGV